MLGGFVLSLVVIFTSRKTIRPALIFAYAAFEGLFVGGISAYFEMHLGGHRPAGDARHALGRRRHPRPVRERQDPRLEASHQDLHGRHDRLPGVLAHQPRPDVVRRRHRERRRSASTASRASCSASRGASSSASSSSSWRRTRWCSTSTTIQQGVRNGAPRKYGWLGGFGIMVTVVWLYIEILRILAIARGSN